VSTLTESRSKPECEHGELWQALDGKWRCVRCEPPHFPGEIADRRSELEVLTLFDESDRTWPEGDWNAAA
jgi:hypothetical protein